MTDDQAQVEPRELEDAAKVHAARDEVVRALGPLAASPLDERAVEEMQKALGRASSPAVRQAVRRLHQVVAGGSSRTTRSGLSVAPVGARTAELRGGMRSHLSVAPSFGGAA
jgi:hypothetical protein